MKTGKDKKLRTSSYYKSKSANAAGRNLLSKIQNIGTVIAGTYVPTAGKNVTSSQNHKSGYNPYALKDFGDIKNYKDAQNFAKDRIKTPNSSSKPSWVYLQNPTNIKIDKSSDFNTMKNNNTLNVKEPSLLINKENNS